MFKDKHLFSRIISFLKKIQKFALIATIIGAILAMAPIFSSCQRDSSKPVESITMGAQLLEAAIPIFIAQDKGFFTKNGLVVNVKAYDTGLNALNGMLNGEVEVAASVSEYIMVGKVFASQPIKILGSYDKINWISIVARKDRGIEEVSDLKGKKIGILPGTNMEFYLGRFLELHGINTRDVTYVDVGAFSQTVDSITSGKVDAVVSAPPYDKMAQSQLGDNAAVWPAQSSQAVYALLVSNNEWLKSHFNEAERFLKAINQSEEYMIQHPQDTKDLSKKKLNLSDDDIIRIWSQNQFLLSLDQSLVIAMEDEARWMIANHLTDQTTMPDFLNYIYSDGLKAAKPEAVNIIK